MASKNEVLKALSDTSRYRPLKVNELAQILPAKPLVLSVQLYRLSKEGFIAKRGKKGGWFIIRQGRARLKIQAKPSTEIKRSKDASLKRGFAAELDATIQSARYSDYGKFLELGKVFRVPPGLVLVTTEHLWRSGDYTDPEVVWRALCEMRIPREQARRWFYSWCSSIERSIPQQLRDKIESR